jgi:hypothetical protein
MGHRLPLRRDNKGQRAPRGRERRRESAAGEVKRPSLQPRRNTADKLLAIHHPSSAPLPYVIDRAPATRRNSISRPVSWSRGRRHRRGEHLTNQLD